LRSACVRHIAQQRLPLLILRQVSQWRGRRTGAGAVESDPRARCSPRGLAGAFLTRCFPGRARSQESHACGQYARAARYGNGERRGERQSGALGRKPRRRQTAGLGVPPLEPAAPRERSGS